MRSVLNPKMLKLQEAFAYAPVIHDVVSDLLQRVERLRLRSQDKSTVYDLASELYKFGFEGQRLKWSQCFLYLIGKVRKPDTNHISVCLKIQCTVL